MRLNALLLSVALFAAVWGAGAQAEAPPVNEPEAAAVTIQDRYFAEVTPFVDMEWPVVEEADVEETSRRQRRVSPLAEQVLQLPPAEGIPEPPTVVAPASMRFEAIGAANAPIQGVGILDNGEMEIPGAREIGWYSYGVSPGEPGSAVLAAHIAFDGERGVFRFLGDSEVGDQFSIVFDDGSERRYELFERAQYNKEELPFDRVFARTGEPIITLISCGGTFQRSLSSYEDNIVAYARPID